MCSGASAESTDPIPGAAPCRRRFGFSCVAGAFGLVALDTIRLGVADHLWRLAIALDLALVALPSGLWWLRRRGATSSPVLSNLQIGIRRTGEGIVLSTRLRTRAAEHPARIVLCEATDPRVRAAAKALAADHLAEPILLKPAVQESVRADIAVTAADNAAAFLD